MKYKLLTKERNKLENELFETRKDALLCLMNNLEEFKSKVWIVNKSNLNDSCLVYDKIILDETKKKLGIAI